MYRYSAHRRCRPKIPPFLTKNEVFVNRHGRSTGTSPKIRVILTILLFSDKLTCLRLLPQAMYRYSAHSRYNPKNLFSYEKWRSLRLPLWAKYWYIADNSYHPKNSPFFLTTNYPVFVYRYGRSTSTSPIIAFILTIILFLNNKLPGLRSLL